MKSLLKNIIFLFLVLLCSCQDFLEEKPIGFIAPDNLYKSDAGAEVACNGIYENFTWYAFDRDYGILTDLSTDDMGSSGTKAYRVQVENHTYSATSSNEAIEQLWIRTWDIINRANSVIENVDGNGSITLSLRERIIGEAKFIRGFIYFNAVRLWGDLPLITTASKSGGDFFVKRDSKDKIYEQIIKDFKDAENVLPQTYDEKNKGRATKGAARTYLAKVYLTLKDYPKAKEKLQEIIDSKVYSLYLNYVNLFTTSAENSVESIWEAQVTANYNARRTPASNWNSQPNPYDGDGYYNFCVTNNLFNLYQDNDIRKSLFYQGEYTTLSGVKAKTYKNFRFTTKMLDKDFPQANAGGVNLMFTRYADVLLMYAEVLNEISNGPTSSAYEAINQVRNRSGLDNLQSGLSKSQFFQEVENERRRELFFECHRWFDLVRWGKLVEVVKAELPTSSITDRNVLYPIPVGATDVNSNLLPNNPGY